MSKLMLTIALAASFVLYDPPRAVDLFKHYSGGVANMLRDSLTLQRGAPRRASTAP